MYLGNIYSIHIDKSTRTTWLFDRFYKSPWLKTAPCDTLHIWILFFLNKGKCVNKLLTETTCNVSLYIKKDIDNYNNILPINESMTSIKNKYSGKVICADSYKGNTFLDEVIKPFVNDMYNDKGDYFFERPLMFVAQNNNSHDSGFGRSNQYYIVGVNYGNIRKSEIQF